VVPVRRLSGRTRLGRSGTIAGSGTVATSGTGIDPSLDALTGLSDNWAFQESLRREVARTRRFREPFVLMLIDIDDFKFVNDNLGRLEGDRILTGLAGALRAGRTADHAFRIGGDDFAVIMTHTALDDVIPAVERIRDVAVLSMGGNTISVGLAEFDPANLDIDATTDAAALRDRAAVALRQAKRRGRDQVVTYTEIAESAPRRTSAATITAVRHLLAGRRMAAAFQPIWNLRTHRIIGFEALARPADEYGLAGPQDAFEGAARLGSVAELDALCRESALAQVGDLPDDVLLFLHISPRVFSHDGESVRQIKDEVETAGLAPDRVVIEFPEDVEKSVDLLGGAVRELRDLGFRLALDDFGAGDSRLGLLARAQPEFVKVDRAVVSGARDGGTGRAALAAIVAYAAESGATVIAEGIESREVLRHLLRAAKTAGGRARFVGGQGYLLGRPEVDPLWRNAPAMAWPLPSGV
jgi:diguanylate cyclase (GGDEF)-like protein